MGLLFLLNMHHHSFPLSESTCVNNFVEVMCEQVVRGSAFFFNNLEFKVVRTVPTVIKIILLCC